jgi:hypothetical protein
MLERPPLPDDAPLPVDLDHLVVEQRTVADRRRAHILVHEEQRISAVRERRLARDEVTHRVALALKVMMLTGEPARGRTRVADVFQVVEAPEHVAVPVHLHEIDLILRAVARVALTRAAEHLPTRQELVGKAL